MRGNPDVPLLIERLQALTENGTIKLNPNFIVGRSGLYALLDCIFSARVPYSRVVLPMLQNRVSARPGLYDHPDLRFPMFLADVDSFGRNKFKRYSAKVLTRHVLAGRIKVQVTYDACSFFVRLGFETKRDFQALPAIALERLVLEDLRREVRGIGPTLGRYLLILLGREEHIKPDVMITRFFTCLSHWVPRYGNERDAEFMREVIAAVASQMGTTPARLDNAIWRYQRGLTFQRRSL